MRRLVPLVIVLAGTALLAVAPAAAAGNQAPVAAAGLDQSVTAGTTVYLDAGGSYDPDGRIVSTEWSIAAPNGSTLTPSCRNCSQPTFTPNATGRWAVTVTVTDDDGATASDTLYVTVGEPRGPAVTLNTPQLMPRSQPMPFVVNATADRASLRLVSVYHNGSRIGNFDVSGSNASITGNHTFGSTGTAELLAVATDTAGYVNKSTVTVQIAPRSRAPRLNLTSSNGGTICGSSDSLVYRGSARGFVCSRSGPDATSSGPNGSTAPSGATGSSDATNSSGGTVWNGVRDDTCSYIRQNCETDAVVGGGEDWRLVDANGDGVLTMTVYSDVFEGGKERVPVRSFTNTQPDQSGITDDNPINSGDDLKEINYNEIKKEVSINAIKKKSRSSNSERNAADNAASDDSGIDQNPNVSSPSSDSVNGGSGEGSVTTGPPSDVGEHYNRDTDSDLSNSINTGSSNSVDTGSDSSGYSPDAGDRGPPYPVSSAESDSDDSSTANSESVDTDSSDSSGSDTTEPPSDTTEHYNRDTDDDSSNTIDTEPSGGSDSNDSGDAGSGSTGDDGTSGYSPRGGERGPPYPPRG